MIPANAIVTQLQAYLQAPEPPLVQVVDALQEIRQLFTVGEQVRAQVAGQLPSGRYAVLVKDQLLDLNLPRNTESGSELDMRVIANSPKLTFLVARGATGDSALPSPTPSATSNQASTVSLSETANFLARLLAEASSSEGGAPPVQGGTPLTTAGLVNVPALAAALQYALEGSGVFYESHLAAWAQGSGNLESLLQEPQGKQSSVSQGNDATDAKAETSKAPAVNLPSTGALELSTDSGNTLRQLDTSDARARSPVPMAGNGAHALNDMPAKLQQIVQQQLQTLDQRQFVWQGQAWQGQPLRWEVEEDRSGQSPDQVDAKPVWRTRLYLELPMLGTIDTTISLTDRKLVDVRFKVDTASTADRIADHVDRLRNQLDAAGLELSSQQVGLSDGGGGG
jgi:hypothetical protein